MNNNDHIRELQNLTLQLLSEHISPTTPSNFSFIKQDKEKLITMMERFKGDEKKIKQLRFLALKKVLQYDLFYFVISPSTKPFYNEVNDSVVNRLLQLIDEGAPLRVQWWDPDLSEKVKSEIIDMLKRIIYKG